MIASPDPNSLAASITVDLTADECAGLFATAVSLEAPLDRARLAVETAEILATSGQPSPFLPVLDSALDALGQARELALFLRGLHAGARLALSGSPWATAETYAETLVDVADAQGLADWSLLGGTLCAEVALQRGDPTEAARLLVEVLTQLDAIGRRDSPLFASAEALLESARSPVRGMVETPEVRARRGIAVAQGHLWARRLGDARTAAAALEGDTLEVLAVRAEVLAEAGPRTHALPAIGRLGAAARRAGDLAREAVAHRLATVLASEPRDAIHHAGLAVPRLTALGHTTGCVLVLAALAEAHHSLGESEAAARELSNAARFLTTTSDLDAAVAHRLAAAAISGLPGPLREAEGLSRREGSVRLRLRVLHALEMTSEATLLARETGFQP